MWPVRKSGVTIWRLTIDYWALNHITPTLAPVVACYPEIMAQIAYSAKYFTVLYLSNAFFALTLHESCWYKFAFSVQASQFTFK